MLTKPLQVRPRLAQSGCDAQLLLCQVLLSHCFSSSLLCSSLIALKNVHRCSVLFLVICPTLSNTWSLIHSSLHLNLPIHGYQTTQTTGSRSQPRELHFSFQSAGLMSCIVYLDGITTVLVPWDSISSDRIER